MTIVLSMKNKFGFIDGSLLKPNGNDLNLLNSWTRNNNMVISWILNSMKRISASIIFSKSTCKIWLDVKDRFQQNNGPKIFHLRSELINHNQNKNSVAFYFAKLKALWEALNNFMPNCTCGKCTRGGPKALNTYVEMNVSCHFSWD